MGEEIKVVACGQCGKVLDELFGTALEERVRCFEFVLRYLFSREMKEG